MWCICFDFFFFIGNDKQREKHPKTPRSGANQTNIHNSRLSQVLGLDKGFDAVIPVNATCQPVVLAATKSPLKDADKGCFGNQTSFVRHGVNL